MSHYRSEDQEDAEALSSGQEDDDDDLDFATPVERPPVHPIAIMQGAFEESMLDSPEEHEAQVRARGEGNADDRRKRLLAQDHYDETVAGRWKMRAGAKFHPLWKLMAQISFGVHLLHRHLAKSDDEVVKILQMHVDEVDSFLETTAEDLDIAYDDVKERTRYLRLPLEHLDIFDTMLDDKTFRTSIIDGNEKIERIVDRQARMTNATMLDVGKGLEATLELARYLKKIGEEWTHGNDELEEIYKAMVNNAEGWIRCFQACQVQGNKVGLLLVQLGNIIGEMSKRAGIASRRNKLTAQPMINGAAGQGNSARITSPPPTSRFSPSTASDKPLPRDPSFSGSRAAPFHLPKEYRQRNGSALSVDARARRRSVEKQRAASVPTTAEPVPPAQDQMKQAEKHFKPKMEARDEIGSMWSAHQSTSDLAEFIRSSGPVTGANSPKPLSLDQRSLKSNGNRSRKGSWTLPSRDKENNKKKAGLSSPLAMAAEAQPATRPTSLPALPPLQQISPAKRPPPPERPIRGPDSAYASGVVTGSGTLAGLANNNNNNNNSRPPTPTFNNTSSPHNRAHHRHEQKQNSNKDIDQTDPLSASASGFGPAAQARMRRDFDDQAPAPQVRRTTSDRGKADVGQKKTTTTTRKRAGFSLKKIFGGAGGRAKKEKGSTAPS